MPKAQTAFTYEKYGFRFPNYFEIKLPDFTLPVFGKVDLKDIIYGLCGGMCFAALDLFHQDQLPPDDRLPDKISSRWYNYLRDRQIDSMQILSLIKLLEWMRSSNDSLVTKMLRTEIPGLIKSINQGEPVVLCLLRASAGTDPTQNHQVLATAYDIDDYARRIVITLYDPNHPYNPEHPQPAPTITAALTKKGFAITQSTGEPLRAFFRMKYRPGKPVPVKEFIEPGEMPLKWDGEVQDSLRPNSD